MAPDARWLDPCVGAGAFTSALAELGTPAHRIQAVDLEKTPQPSDAAATVTRGVDFISWARKHDGRFDRIVANPPYIAIGRLPMALRDKATAVQLDGSTAVSRGANYWCAFLCQSLELLAEGGAVCFLLPASWEYADYAVRIRETVPTKFETFEVHRSKSPLFPSVQDGSTVIVGRGFGRPARVQRYLERDGLSDLVKCLGSAASEDISSVDVVSLPQATGPERVTPLRDVMHIGIGAVTGDAGYFLMTEAQRKRLGLPISAMQPVVTRARDLNTSFLGDEEWLKLRRANSRIWLFRPGAATITHPAVHDYLKLTQADGGCDREAGKVAERDPWFRTPLPAKPDGFMSGMSRWGPWVCLRRKQDLTASNTLYAVRFRHRLDMDMKAAWCLSLLTTRARDQVLPSGRRYPDGLLKYEPSDLGGILLPNPSSGRGAITAYRTGVRALIQGRLGEATDIADRWFADSRRARGTSQINHPRSEQRAHGAKVDRAPTAW